MAATTRSKRRSSEDGGITKPSALSTTIANGISTFFGTIWTCIWRTVLETLLYLNIYHYFWRPFYIFLNYLHNNGTAPLKFMNYGYVCQNDEDRKILSSIDAALAKEPKIEHTYIRLYERVFSLCPWYPAKLAGKDFFEVSCGHMGGVEWFAKAHPEMKSVRGLDMSPPDPNDPRVVVGDAQNMPMPNESVDIIMNVEATHCYGDEGEFYKECMRILRPGGYLCWTDFRPIGWYEEKVFRLSAKAGLKLVTKIDVTAGVLDALDIQTTRVQGFFQKNWYTRYMSFMWNAFWGVPGTAVYRDLKNGKWVYVAACWQKPLEAAQ